MLEWYSNREFTKISTEQYLGTSQNPKDSCPYAPPNVSDEEWQAIQMEFVDDEENILKADAMKVLL